MSSEAETSLTILSCGSSERFLDSARNDRPLATQAHVPPARRLILFLSELD